MIVFDDFRHTFYGMIRKDHVLVVTNVDTDAVCAVQILLDLFAADDIAYTLVPVDSWETFQAAMEEHGEQARSVVLFNCGGTKPLASFLRPNMTFYVIDSRRPFDLENVYYDDNIRLIVSPTERDRYNIPSISEVEITESSSSDESGSEDEAEGEKESGRDETGGDREMEEDTEAGESQDSMSEQVEVARTSENGEEQEEEEGRSGGSSRPDGSGEGGSGRGRKRVRDVAEAIEQREIKRRRRMERKKHREDVLWDYYENSWYAASSAVLMLEIAHSVGRSVVEMMWCAVVGLSSQLVEYSISHSCYTAVCFERLRSFIRKFIPEGSDVVRGDDILRLAFDKEIMLPFYAHWSLYASMINNDFFFCQTQMWQQSGLAVMKALLAELEITLEECHQVYSALTSERKKDIFKRIDKEMDDNFASFIAHVGYSSRYNACDFARAISGRISYGVVEVESPYDRFIGGQEILQRFMEGFGDTAPLSKAIESYKGLLTTLVNLVFMSIRQSLIVSAGPFYILCLPQEDEARVLHSRHFLNIFSNYALRAFNAASRKKNRADRPLFVAVPMSGENAGWFLVTGIMPLNAEYDDNYQKSFIGRAFEKVVNNFIRDGARQNFFDPTMVMIRADQKPRFFETLTAILEIG